MKNLKSITLGAFVSFALILGSCGGDSTCDKDKEADKGGEKKECSQEQKEKCKDDFKKEAMITEQEVQAAQQEWGNAIVAIGKAMTDGEDHINVASDYIDQLYAYQLGTVLFKPTKAADIQFRGTKAGALSYFVGENQDFPEDHGFAMQPWTKVRFENTGIITGAGYALAMGNYFFTTTDGEEVKVEFSFGYIKDEDGNLRINLHHSSFPYQKK